MLIKLGIKIRKNIESCSAMYEKQLSWNQKVCQKVNFRNVLILMMYGEKLK